uniref:Uncharacterized protein n=1 Tax=Rhizophora mucronata TaxID=61149 RepID=A0A2P2NK77_RHIMU
MKCLFSCFPASASPSR